MIEEPCMNASSLEEADSLKLYVRVQVCEPRKEHEGTKEMFCSYGIRAEVSGCGERR